MSPLSKPPSRLRTLIADEYFPRADNPNQFRMRFETTLSCALLLNMSWNFSLVDFYDTEPAVSVPNNDFQLRSSIGIKF